MSSPQHPGHRLLVGTLIIYLVALAAVVFSPAPVDRESGHALAAALKWLHARGLPTWFDYALIEWLSNVVMFLPLGFLLAALFRRGSWWGPALIGLATSIAIETGQQLFLPQRTASLFDVAANALGAAAGAGLLVIFVRIRRGTR